MLTSSPGPRYPASVASPSGGNSEYLMGLQNGLFASVSAGRIIFTRIAHLSRDNRPTALLLRPLLPNHAGHCQPTRNRVNAIPSLKLLPAPAKHCQQPPPAVKPEAAHAGLSTGIVSLVSGHRTTR